MKVKYRIDREDGEFVLSMLANDGAWDWIGNFATKEEAQAEIAAIKAESSADPNISKTFDLENK